MKVLVNNLSDFQRKVKFLKPVQNQIPVKFPCMMNITYLKNGQHLLEFDYVIHENYKHLLDEDEQIEKAEENYYYDLHCKGYELF